jgi:hypothetical protein
MPAGDPRRIGQVNSMSRDPSVWEVVMGACCTAGLMALAALSKSLVWVMKLGFRAGVPFLSDLVMASPRLPVARAEVPLSEGDGLENRAVRGGRSQATNKWRE